MKIQLFITGGTIDARYNPSTAKVDAGYNNPSNAKVDHDGSHIADMLRQGRSKVDIDLEELMLVDSRDITDEQRQLILEKCHAADTEKIIITHGTDTMVQTAEFLGQNIKDKTVVLVGAMVPFVYMGSDAPFNLGSAVTAVQLLHNGVYITMNGKVFNWDNVQKNFDTDEFQEK